MFFWDSMFCVNMDHFKAAIEIEWKGHIKEHHFCLVFCQGVGGGGEVSSCASSPPQQGSPYLKDHFMLFGWF